MNILWSPEAIEDLNSVRAYIAQDNPSAARTVVLHILQNVEQLLPDNPQMGRPGRVPGTRELVIPKTPFIVPYRLQRNVIQILRTFAGHFESNVMMLSFLAPIQGTFAFPGSAAVRLRSGRIVTVSHIDTKQLLIVSFVDT